MGDKAHIESSTALLGFLEGRDGLRPAAHVVGAAYRLALAAIENHEDVGVTLDEDGGLTFDVQLRGGRRLVGSMRMNGQMDFGLHDTDLERHSENTTEGQVIGIILGDSTEGKIGDART